MEQLLENYRITGGGTAALYLDNTPYLNFGGNNYLAIGQRPELRKAAQAELDNDLGYSMYLPRAYGAREEAFERAEQEASLFFGTEASVYLPSGYFIGHAALKGLEPYFDVVVLDELAHWCIWMQPTCLENPFFHSNIVI